MAGTVMNPTPGIDFGAVIEQLRLAVFVFEGSRLLYQNPAAANLAKRLRDEYQVELLVMLRDHTLRALEQPDGNSSAVTLLTAARGEPFYVHVVPIAHEAGDRQVAVSVRELGIEREAFARRYRLSPREAEVAELVLRGYRNPDIAASLGVASSTVKRHLTRIFDKIGVDSRTQLIGRLA
jgi:DNA-binding CsgD family transcriptional regulator